jgi:hypothetical protein
MRLGLLGPAGSASARLREAAEFLLGDERAERVVYLGSDGALDAVAEAWARQLVGGDPSLRGLTERAAMKCAVADPDSIDAFVASERQLERLLSLESLPGGRDKTIEVCEGKIAVLTHDKALLDQEDLLPASYLIFGRGSEPVSRHVGPRWFLSPGPLRQGAVEGLASGGIALLTHEDDGASWTLYDRPGNTISTTPLATQTAARVTVHP